MPQPTPTPFSPAPAGEERRQGHDQVLLSPAELEDLAQKVVEMLKRELRLANEREGRRA
ncbi:MAG: hypothetical protein GYA17_07595 [Chloroflexi bacterium]|jgi:hypothetical protein|nr:hypothetical protein [Anaerolineaceae bacterium]NMB88208.1 hypothetical protein [Chloroflexota bacterium]